MTAVAIIGPGRVGTALWLALQGRHDTVAVAGGSPAGQELFRRRTGVPVSPDPLPPCRAATWVFLTVPDRVVAALADDLAAAGAFHAGQVVAHTAGALPSSVLAPAQAHGAEVLALHPMQSFAEPGRGSDLFQGVTCSLEGTPAALQAGAELAASLGMRPWQVRAADKPRLHAACSLASNALVALLAVAASTAAESGAPFARAQAIEALLPLCRGSLENLARVGLPGALTGPVERGDMETVRTHLDLLSGTAEDAYRALALVAVELAREKGSLGTAESLQLQEMLRR
jgi:predicted short-subunit dehydrogenase-like oxidoreductase (DUF2520 family)